MGVARPQTGSAVFNAVPAIRPITQQGVAAANARPMSRAATAAGNR